MSVSTEAGEAIQQTLSHFGQASFSTKQFIDRFKVLHPAEWSKIEALFGPGGKGAGRHYSSFSFVSQTLHRMFVSGNLKKLDYQPAPPGWGSPVIRYWTAAESIAGGALYPDEQHGQFSEGLATQVLVNRFERDSKARQKCIDHYGLSCRACDLDFEQRYGVRGAGFIHVHHLKPMHQRKGPYTIDPIADLRPVCPNCHAMIHYRTPMLTLDELRSLLATHSK